MFSRKWPQIASDEVFRRSRLLVIDDQDFTYLGLFQDQNYNITKWNDVDDLPQIESGQFDLVLLDLQGVGSSLSADEGLGVLRHLRRNYPTVVTVAYSAADWRLKYQPFFQEADATLDKAADFLEFKGTVDRLLLSRLEFDFYLERASAIAGVRIDSDSRLEKRLRHALLPQATARDRGRLAKALSAHVEAERVERVVQLSQLGAAVLQVFLTVSA